MRQRMQALALNGFDIYFSELSDPRISRTKLYPLIEILFVVLCGSICGRESWRDFVLFGKEKIDLLRQYYPLQNKSMKPVAFMYLPLRVKEELINHFVYLAALT